MGAASLAGAALFLLLELALVLGGLFLAGFLYLFFDDLVTERFIQFFTRVLGVPISVGRVQVRRDGVTIEGLTIPNPQIDGVKWEHYAIAEMARVRISTTSLLNTLSLFGMCSLRFGPLRLPFWVGFGVREIEAIEVTTLWLYVDEKLQESATGGSTHRVSNLGHFALRMRKMHMLSAAGGLPAAAAGSAAAGPAAPSGKEAKGADSRDALGAGACPPSPLCLSVPGSAAAAASGSEGSAHASGSTTPTHLAQAATSVLAAASNSLRHPSCSLLSTAATAANSLRARATSSAASRESGPGSERTTGGCACGARSGAGPGAGGGGGGGVEAEKAASEPPSTAEEAATGLELLLGAGDEAGAEEDFGEEPSSPTDGPGLAPGLPSSRLFNPLEKLRKLGERQRAAVANAIHGRFVGSGSEQHAGREPVFGAFLRIGALEVRQIHLKHGEVSFRLESWVLPGGFQGDNATFARTVLGGMVERAMTHAVLSAKDAVNERMQESAAVAFATVQSNVAMVSNFVGTFKTIAASASTQPPKGHEVAAGQEVPMPRKGGANSLLNLVRLRGAHVNGQESKASARVALLANADPLRDGDSHSTVGAHHCRASSLGGASSHSAESEPTPDGGHG